MSSIVHVGQPARLKPSRFYTGRPNPEAWELIGDRNTGILTSIAVLTRRGPAPGGSPAADPRRKARVSRSIRDRA
jgi:hypothetical protein